MNTKIKRLCDKITPEQFEAMILLCEASQGHYVIASDISISGKQKYYDLFDESSGEKILLVISLEENELNFDVIEASNPGYDDYIGAEFDDDDKSYMLEWISAQAIVPDFLKNIHIEAEKNRNFFE